MKLAQQTGMFFQSTVFPWTKKTSFYCRALCIFIFKDWPSPVEVDSMWSMLCSKPYIFKCPMFKAWQMGEHNVFGGEHQSHMEQSYCRSFKEWVSVTQSDIMWHSVLSSGNTYLKQTSKQNTLKKWKLSFKVATTFPIIAPKSTCMATKSDTFEPHFLMRFNLEMHVIALSVITSVLCNQYQNLDPWSNWGL